MNHQELCDLLYDAGFEDGWTLQDLILTTWEHDADPPAPLTRPEVSDVVAD
jgi:hypothetical protein